MARVARLSLNFPGLGLVLLVGLVLRLISFQGDLWLDEVKSIELAASARSLFQLLFELKLDNNHPLNTIYLWATQPETAQAARMASLIWSLGALGLAYYFTAQVDKRAAPAALLLHAVCYPIVLLTVEARGYGGAMFFSLAGLVLLRHSIIDSRAGSGMLSALCLLIAVLFHGTAVFMAAGAAAWVGAHYFLRRSRPSLLITLAFGSTGLLAAAYCVLVYMGQHVAGGMYLTPTELLMNSASLVLGGPLWDSYYASGTLPTVIYALVLGSIVVFCFPSFRRRMPEEAALVAVAAFFAPAALIAVLTPDTLFERYFLLPMVLLHHFIAIELTAAHRRGGLGRACSLAVATMCFLGNAAWSYRLLEFGRGEYTQAFDAIAVEREAEQFEVTGDFDARIEPMVTFYRPDWSYIGSEERSSTQPRWLLKHFHYPLPGPEEAVLVGSDSYSFRRRFEFSGLSGFGIDLYRRSNPG